MVGVKVALGGIGMMVEAGDNARKIGMRGESCGICRSLSLTLKDMLYISVSVTCAVFKITNKCTALLLMCNEFFFVEKKKTLKT